MKKTIATLSALLIAAGIGCPRHKPESEYRYYTDPQEITDRFVVGENVDVRNALCYDPTQQNLYVKALYDFLMKSSRASLETIRTIYLQYGADDDYASDSTVGTIERAVEIANIYGDPTQVFVGTGVFGYSNMIINYVPLRLDGEGTDNSSIDTIIESFGFFESHGITYHGADVAGIQASLAIFGGGYVSNNRFEGNNAGVAIDPEYDTRFEWNVVHSVNHPRSNVSISFESLEDNKDNTTGVLTMHYNTISDTERGIMLTRSAEAGVEGSAGNNLFLNVGTVVFNPYNLPQPFQGNAWAETTTTNPPVKEVIE